MNVVFYIIADLGPFVVVYVCADVGPYVVLCVGADVDVYVVFCAVPAHLLDGRAGIPIIKT